MRSRDLRQWSGGGATRVSSPTGRAVRRQARPLFGDNKITGMKHMTAQTMTTDDGSSLAQAQVHENVRYDILRADARQLAATINRDLIQPFIAFNFGPQERYPTVDLPVAEAEDIKTLSDALTKLVPLGLKVSMAEVREKIGLSEPEEDADVLTPAAKPKADRQDKPEADEPDDEDADDPATARACPSCGEIHATARTGEETDELDELLEGALDEWGADLAPVMDQLQAEFAAASSYEDLKVRLDRLAGTLDVGPLARRIADLALIARGLGDAG
jgi:phage gp29-like protein